MNKKLKDRIRRLATRYLPSGILNKLEFDRQKFLGFNERPVEFAFVFNCLKALNSETILDVGTGITALPRLMRNCGAHVTAVDNITDYWPSGMKNRHYHILDKDITSSDLTFDRKFDVITCISVLEHIVDHNSAMKNMLDNLKSGGHLVLTCPYSENNYVADTYKLPDSNAAGMDSPFVCQSYSRKELEHWISSYGGQIVTQEYWQIFSGNVWSVGNRISPPIQKKRDESHQLTCVLIKKK